MYLVDELDLAEGVALVRPADPGYSTAARQVTAIEVTRELRQARWGDAEVHFGDVQVRREVVGFIRRHPDTGRPLGEFPLSLPPQTLRTRAVWWTISASQRGRLAGSGGGPARRGACRRACVDRVAAPVCRVRSLGRRRCFSRSAPGHRAAYRFRLRRARWRGGVRRAWLPRGARVAAARPPTRSGVASARRGARLASSRPNAGMATSPFPSRARSPCWSACWPAAAPRSRTVRRRPAARRTAGGRIRKIGQDQEEYAGSTQKGGDPRRGGERGSPNGPAPGGQSRARTGKAYVDPGQVTNRSRHADTTKTCFQP